MAIAALASDVACALGMMLGAAGQSFQASAGIDASAPVVAATIAAGVAASVLALVAARAQRLRRLRQSWGLVGVGIACGTLGLLTRGLLAWTGQPGSPALAGGLVFAVAALLAWAGVMLRPALGVRRVGRLLLVFDVALWVSALVAFGWPVALGPLFAGMSLDALAQVVAVLPLASSVGMVAALVLGREREGPPRRSEALLLGAGVAASLAGAALILDALGGDVRPLIASGAFATVAFALVAVAAYGDWAMPPEPRQPIDVPVGSTFQFVAPFLLLGIVTVVVVGAPPVGQVAVGIVALALAWAFAVGRATVAYGAQVQAHRGERELRIEHAGSFREEQRRRRQLEAIRDVSTELTHQLDLTTLLDLITRRATELVGASGGAVCLWDDASQALVPRSWHNLGTWIGTVRLRLGEGAAGAAGARRRGIIVNDYPTSSVAHAPSLAHLAISAVAATPILLHDELIGVLVAIDEQPGRRFEEQDLDLLALFADQAALGIDHARLFESVAMTEGLRELARLKTEFLSTASHELRTPLTLIHGYAELLRMRASRLAASEVAEMADEILGGSTTMIRLVDDLLDFARLESSRPNVEPRRLDVEQFVRHQLTAIHARPGGDRVTADIPGALVADVDPSLLQQILRNILTNALQYAPHGPIVVRARRRAEWLVVEVADEGPGIPSREQERVWETFYRGEHARVSPHRGSGLGLAVVKQLAELQGGRVEIESTSGLGATFRVWLPASAEANAAPIRGGD